MQLLGLCLKKHVPIGNSGWEKATCAGCGEECWMTPYAKNMKLQNHAVLLCSMCVSESLYLFPPSKK